MSEIQDSVRNRPVSSIMQREVIAVDEGWSLEQLADFLVDKKYGEPLLIAKIRQHTVDFF